MLASFDPNAEMGASGMFVLAGVLALVATGALVTGLRPRWRATATWREGVRRSVFGSAAFALGLLILGAAMVVRGVLDQHGSFAGVPLLLLCCGTAVLAIGIVYDI